MKQIQLPKDLRRAVQAAVWKRVLPFVVCETAVVAVLVLWSDVLLPTEIAAAKVIFSVVLLLLPFFLFRFPWSLFDATFYGRVEEVEVVTTVHQKGARYNIYYKNTVYLRLREPDGSLVRRRAAVEKGSFVSHFHAGDEVFHLYGANHTIVLSDDALDDAVICSVCAETNRNDHTVCPKCGHTLLKKKHFEEKETSA